MTVLSEMHQECLRCRVPGDCKPGHDRCGVSRGMRYGIYPETAHKHATAGLPGWFNFKVGADEVPLFSQRDMMTDFCSDVAKYEEPWMRLEKWGMA